MPVHPDVKAALQRERAKDVAAQQSRPEVDCEVMPDWFHPGQVEAWESVKKILLVLAGNQSGKALPLDTPIATPSGFRPMGDLRVGDEVLCPDGSVAIVTATSPVMHGHDCYRVAFDDGTTVVADAGHLWKTYTHRQRKNNTRNGRDDFSTVTTREILETLKDGTLNNHSIPMPEPAWYPERDLPIDPYTLGAWLGDGNSNSASITCADPQIIEEIRSAGLLCGAGRECNSGKALLYSIGMSRIGAGGNWRGRDSLNTKLREIGLVKNKHIPPEYLIASAGQRLALLQGLMDTDGYCSLPGKDSIKRACEFSVSNERLAGQVLELCRSLGIKAKLKWRTVNGFKSGRLTFTTTLPVFRLKRKLDRLPRTVRADCTSRFIVSVEPVESVPVKCIAVSHPDRLYLCTRDYVPTHNTVSGPRLLRREIQRTANRIRTDADPPNDYLVAGPTLSLLRRKAIPEFLRVFPNDPEWGHWDKANSIYHFTPQGSRRLLGYEAPITVFFGYAENPDSLAAMTAKAVWIDEGGQKQFKRDSFEEIQNRTLTTNGRVFITTTAYVQTGWLRELHDLAEQGSSYIGIVRFKTEDLGRHLLSEGRRLKDRPVARRGLALLRTVANDRKRLPAWMFAMRREGRFVKPPGAVYDCFDGEFGQERSHTTKRFAIPKEWKRVWGLDFGPVHTCCVMAAVNPKEEVVDVEGKPKKVKDRLYVYACYFPQERGQGRRTYREHSLGLYGMDMRHSVERSSQVPSGVFGGAKAEEEHRAQFQREGVPVQSPRYENDVARQIEATYGAFKNGEVVFFDDLKGLIEEVSNYSYEVDEEQNVDDTKILDKGSCHRCDALRYLVATVKPGFVSQPKTVSRFVKEERKDSLPFRM